MKAKIAVPEPQRRLAVTIRKSTMDKLNLYQQFAQHTHAASVKQADLTDAILAQFMESDKSFRDWEKEQDATDIAVNGAESSSTNIDADINNETDQSSAPSAMSGSA